MPATKKDRTRLNLFKIKEVNVARRLLLDDKDTKHKLKNKSKKDVFEVSHKRALVQGEVNLPSIELNAVQDAYVVNSIWVKHNFSMDDFWLWITASR